MPTVERIETWRGQDVLDADGEKAGRLEDVYYDADAEEPILLSVKHGMLGRQVTLVPAVEVVLCRDYLRVPYSTEQIHQSRGVADEEVSSEQLAAVGELFKLTLASSGPLHSASLIERRRVEAEEAAQRASELKQEAQRRAQELEEAQARAGAAAEQAKAAERERDEANAASIETGHQPQPGR